jgi:UDP-N-acetyl-D-glucosamine dehydrogenase
LLPIFQGRGAKVGEDFFLAFSPERIDPANQTFKVKDIPKVVGGVTAACTRLAATLYGQIVPHIHEVSSPKVAELAKLYENVFRNVNIALANEFALMCRRLGVSTKEVIDAAATKPFGFMPFLSGSRHWRPLHTSRSPLPLVETPAGRFTSRASSRSPTKSIAPCPRTWLTRLPRP